MTATPFTSEDILAVLIREALVPKQYVTGVDSSNGQLMYSQMTPLLQPVINSITEIVKNDGVFKQRLIEAVMLHIDAIAKGIAEKLVANVLDTRQDRGSYSSNVTTVTTTVAKWAEDLVTSTMAMALRHKVQDAVLMRLPDIDLAEIDITVSAAVVPKVKTVPS